MTPTPPPPGAAPAARDPRRDPIPGDVLGTKRLTRKVISAGWRVRHRASAVRVLWVSDTPLDQEGRPMDEPDWRRWARNAEVIRAAPESSAP